MTGPFWYMASHAERAHMEGIWFRTGQNMADRIMTLGEARVYCARAIKLDRPRDQESWEPLLDAFCEGYAARRAELPDAIQRGVA